MPFLYLPDAVSLALLLLTLTLLRRCASLHLRGELQALRMELIECRGHIGAASVARACIRLTCEIDSALRNHEQMSPARLLFLARTLKIAPPESWADLLPEWTSGLESPLDPIGDQKAERTLRKIELQIHTNLGVFYLLASVSGWLVAARIVIALIRRALSQSGTDRIDWFFDMAERVLIRHGRRAHKVALLMVI